MLSMLTMARIPHNVRPLIFLHVLQEGSAIGYLSNSWASCLTLSVDIDRHRRLFSYSIILDRPKYGSTVVEWESRISTSQDVFFSDMSCGVRQGCRNYQQH